jgi:hypothetical protein
MLIDDVMPQPDFFVVVDVVVDADVATTWAAIDTANLAGDPIVRVLSALREIPNQIAARRRGEPVERLPAEFTFADISEGTGWVTLGEQAGVERVVGAVGQFWKRDYGWVDVAPEDFTAFDEPGYARTVTGFAAAPYGSRRTLLRMDSRTDVTDEHARARFRLYWRLLRPFAALMMRRALACIKAEAERRSAASPGTAAPG